MAKKKQETKSRVRLFVFGTIVLLAIMLRFVRYNERWGLAYDQARDAIIAAEVLRGKPMPVIGPFSSAGNFTTGPVWYWFVSAASALYPPAITTPWVVLTVAYVGSVVALMFVGHMIGGTALAVILGLFAAVSPAQIDQGLNLTNPSLVAVCATLVVWSGLWFVKTGRMLPLMLMAFAAGCAVTAHYQSALLGVYILLVLASKRPTVRQVLLFLAAGVIPFIPLLYFDVTHGWYNYRGVVDYFQYGQYKIYIPNRWLTYIGQFLPHLWEYVIGGQKPIGYLLMGVSAVAVCLAYWKKLFTRFSVSILVSFAVMVGTLRYYRGERYESYFVFLHPFILIVSAWAVWVVWKWQKIVGAALVLAVIVGSLAFTIPEILRARNHTALQTRAWIQTLTTKYPGKQFDLYDYRYGSTNKSFPLVLFMDHAGLLSPTGHKIGFGVPSFEERPWHREITENKIGYDLWDLASSSTSGQLAKVGWSRINPEDIYRGVTQWFSK